MDGLGSEIPRKFGHLGAFCRIPMVRCGFPEESHDLKR